MYRFINDNLKLILKFIIIDFLISIITFCILLISRFFILLWCEVMEHLVRVYGTFRVKTVLFGANFRKIISHLARCGL